MEKFICGKTFDNKFHDNFFECGSCGNHICGEQAKRLKGVCPHCFGRLYLVN